MPPDTENLGRQRDPSQKPAGFQSQAIEGYFVPGGLPTHEEDEISFLDVYRLLIKYRVIIGSITLATTLAAVLAALLMTPIYRAEVLMAPALFEEGEPALSALAAQFGGLASFGGPNLGRGSDTDKAIASLNSREFTEKFIEDEQLFPVLFADKPDLKYYLQ